MAAERGVSSTVTRLAQMHVAFAETAKPACAARAAALADERAFSDIVDRAFDLTPEAIALTWRTAPPRAPPARPLIGGSVRAKPTTDLG